MITINKVFIVFLFSFLFLGCSASYNGKINKDNEKQDFEKIQYSDSSYEIEKMRAIASDNVKSTFDELDKMERYTAKTKTSDDRFKMIMRDFKRDSE